MGELCSQMKQCVTEQPQSGIASGRKGSVVESLEKQWCGGGAGGGGEQSGGGEGG